MKILIWIHTIQTTTTIEEFDVAFSLFHILTYRIVKTFDKTAHNTVITSILGTCTQEAHT